MNNTVFVDGHTAYTNFNFLGYYNQLGGIAGSFNDRWFAGMAIDPADTYSWNVNLK
jgi:hypothetical protein